MADYISRDKAVAIFEALKNGTLEDGNRMAAAVWKLSAGIVSRLPAADVEPVRHGRWIPVSKKMPEERGCYLVTVKHWYDGKPVTREAFWNGADWLSCEKRMEITPRVTHWMPLPEPPKEGGAEDG